MVGPLVPLSNLELWYRTLPAKMQGFLFMEKQKTGLRKPAYYLSGYKKNYFLTFFVRIVMFIMQELG